MIHSHYLTCLTLHTVLFRSILLCHLIFTFNFQKTVVEGSHNFMLLFKIKTHQISVKCGPIHSLCPSKHFITLILMALNYFENIIFSHFIFRFFFKIHALLIIILTLSTKGSTREQLWSFWFIKFALETHFSINSINISMM